MKQAVVCPESSEMMVDSNKIINQKIENKKENQLSIETLMVPNGDKFHTIEIKGLKIFVKF